MPWSAIRSNALSLQGAIIGAVLGVVAFRWIAQQGFYAPVVPGGFVGVGCAMLARTSSTARGLACALLALAAGLYAEWSVFPFRKDEHLTYFLTHIHQLKPITLILIGLGAVVAYWVGRDHLFGRWLGTSGTD